MLKNITRILLPALMVAALAFPVAGSAKAAVRIVGDNAVKVNFSDLDLTRGEGVRTLYDRLRAAASLACDNTTGREILGIAALKKQCFDDALSNAVHAINNERLTRLHEAG